MDSKTAFLAYPSTPSEIGRCITAAVATANARKRGILEFNTWEENDIAGRHLTAPIFSGIEHGELLVADITKVNFNVSYEIGYAIGIKKRVFLVQNSSLESDSDKIRKIGIFDTLGFEKYRNDKDLAKLLSKHIDLSPIKNSSTPDKSAPVYIVETPSRSQSMGAIIARVKKARLHYRSFNPGEETRLAAIEAIDHVSSSFGVVIPLASNHVVDWEIHNTRAAFVAGLAHGMSKPTLILQDSDGPIPLDIRDFAKCYKDDRDIARHIQKFALDVVQEIQQEDEIVKPEVNLLSKLSIGNPMAENEFQSLRSYYLETDEFGRSLRGEVNLVVGRKGTGKTALFSQVRNAIRRDKKNIVVDLKPEGYQLIKLKEEVIDVLATGAKNHLITAFWEYILYLEIAYKILEKDSQIYMRDQDLYDPYVELESAYLSNRNINEGDFSERLLKLSILIVDSFKNNYVNKKGVRLNTDNVTELLRSEGLNLIRERISTYLERKGEAWVLFDNLDKGWSTQGLHADDVMILRCLIDASRKMQRDMQKSGHGFQCIVFVRNDVYQLLMDTTSDFGKEMRASLDWSDPDLLREMLRKRLAHADLKLGTDFASLWNSVCVSHYAGEETSQYFIDRSLMRPRNLLKIFIHCRGFAVNLGHQRIEDDDIVKGLNAYSNDLVIEADQELTDVEPDANGLIYQFLGERSDFSIEELEILMDLNEVPKEKQSDIVSFLLYYGFLGIRYADQEPKFIYDVGYDMKIMQTRITKNREATVYTLNPAFWPALEVTGS